MFKVFAIHKIKHFMGKRISLWPQFLRPAIEIVNNVFVHLDTQANYVSKGKGIVMITVPKRAPPPDMDV